MRTWLLLLTLIVACTQVVAGSTHAVLELDAVAQRLIGELDTLRAHARLEPLEVDTVRCEVADRRFQKCVDMLGDGFFQNSLWREDMDRIVEDWGKWCVVARAESVSGLVASLLESPGLAEAALDPDATHAVAAAGTGAGGGVWCALCVSHRVIDFGMFTAEFAEMGPCSLTLTGVSRSRYLLIESSVEGEEGAPHQSVPFEADETGEFAVTLSFRGYGSPQHRLIISVRDNPEQEYRPAARMYFPASLPCMGRSGTVREEAE